MSDTLDSIIHVHQLSKTYASGFQALQPIDLSIQRGEIFALLGPNGAGKTTLISIVCGLVNPSTGSVAIDGHDIIKQYRQARSKIGLVPQELSSDSFETVWNSVNFSRGLFGKKPNPALIESILKDLSLWDKKDQPQIALSGGMKRRVLIAKALSHEPEILFLDEPTAGVDVTLRQGMWALVHKLRTQGVTIILTTHYIEEAEEMADRIGIINRGQLQLVETKQALMQRLGGKTLVLSLAQPLSALPSNLQAHGWQLKQGQDKGGSELHYQFQDQSLGLDQLLSAVHAAQLQIADIQTRQRSLENIFVELTGEQV
ncbi:ABC transporter ATP-binding protein [Alcaligenes endophyticus]|uniref:ABC transporter ATP-binding protein n=1 Tax=Alcaligenes endophyticus TaxID=1929088 RepID=A0ABT8EKB2_9BURK|nr:ABC transporter ATP-binding protein [Alcaligenes endophyticus]MCX5591970.1 ABC transporter ATP-binding protein [Alcaligenes endophyticus]MDN4121660.1 ABC transporter ATP-binding protein [Alcaligenes endophyticus]